MDLATLCDSYVVVTMAPMDAIWLVLVKTYTVKMKCGYQPAIGVIYDTAKVAITPNKVW